MLGKKDNDSKLIYNFVLDNFIPEDHILRIIDANINFNFIYNKVKHLYSQTGKRSIDPKVLFKMLLICY